MNNAMAIALALNRHLYTSTEIVVYGAAALLLETRFAERLSGRRTNDVDIIIPARLELQINADRQFWTAIEATNHELEPQGLFISHIFPEAEVVLTPEWERHLLAVDGPHSACPPSGGTVVRDGCAASGAAPVAGDARTRGVLFNVQLDRDGQSDSL
jgi:hypothetical protein